MTAADTTFQADSNPDSGPTLHSSSQAEWTLVLSSPCGFSRDVFEEVMLNLIRNPNITSSHLFRADIYYDSDKDASTLNVDHSQGLFSSRVQHMKQELRPLECSLKDFRWRRTLVRNLVPRNNQLDKDLVQTCHMLCDRNQHGPGSTTAVVYLPHVDGPDQMPWYHPCVQALAFTYTSSITQSEPARIGIYLHPFTSRPLSGLQPRIDRTCLKLLQTIHRHGKGRMQGYQKRGQHDQIIPQRAFQDTYARLKQKYAKRLIGDWVEQTDPTKHVFEDLGIAAFLIELWREMYGVKPADEIVENGHKGSRRMAKDTTGERSDHGPDEGDDDGRRMPEFIDIGCGNGVLVHILICEGYKGWGFDVRRRKTWETFDDETRSCLKEMVLVPSVLKANSPASHQWIEDIGSRRFHDGHFESGTFIISNHADELTAWTPLLAYLNDSPFIAIPCCSHDLSGARFRASELTKRQRDIRDSQKSQRSHHQATSVDTKNKDGKGDGETQIDVLHSKQAAEKGSLQRPATNGKKQMPSAYATLCSYVMALAGEIGFEKPEKEMLRIPSTRNACVIGRRVTDRNVKATADGTGVVDGMASLGIDCDARNIENRHRGVALEERRAAVCELVERELSLPLDEIGKRWLERAYLIAGKKTEGH